MKHSRVTAGSFAAVLTPLAGIAASLAWALPARGGEVPFTEHVISTSANHAMSVFATDVDGDGDTDVLSASNGDDKIAWYESDGGSPPTFTERVISTAARLAESVFAADVDGDGDTDILSASWIDDKIAWYESDGASPPGFTERVISTTADGAFSVFATDVDGDGDTDVLSASNQDNKIAWYESDGGSPPTFTERVISTTADWPLSVSATDVDGDGDTDVLSASALDWKIAWYESDGLSPPSFTERVISTAANYAISVFATDVDGDGDTDVLSASYWDDKIAWYESDGGSPPTFTERVISTSAGGPHSVFATDVDGDGDTDVLSASYYIAWYENDGGSPPTFTERVISTTAMGFASVFATDVDGDGDTDVLSASFRDDKIAWYENTAAPIVCGDGVVEGPEECDDGYTDACGSCNADCTGGGTGSMCGDGELCPETEQCDDGYTDACGSCNGDCTGAGTGSMCGDGVVCPETESCDDGYTDDCGTCNVNCTGPGSGSTCGDGDVCPQTEDCDDGNTNNGDCCSSVCQREPSGSPCDDGNACTTGDACEGDAAETCQGTDTSGVDCDDGIACTTDTCAPATGCANTSVDAACDDGDPCTGSEACDPASGCVHQLSEDCNGNQIEDSCDIDGATSEDCNTNSIPDECDIAAGTSDDRNGNGVPDECDGCAALLVEVCERTVGGGGGSMVAPVEDMEICTFETSEGSCAAGYGRPRQHYSEIFNNCEPVACDPTDEQGLARLILHAGDYVVIGEYDPDGFPPNDDGDELYPGTSARDFQCAPDNNPGTVTMEERFVVIILPNGHTVVVNVGAACDPGRGDDPGNTMLVMTNVGGPDDSISLVSRDANLSATGGGYTTIGAPVVMDSSLNAGELFMTVSIPFDVDALAGADPLSLDLAHYDSSGDAWQLGVAGNTQASRGHEPNVIGDRYVVVDTMVPELSGDLGDYGVFWNPALGQGFVWANVDHASDFAGGSPSAGEPIPAVSEWGLIIMSLLLLAGLKIYFGRLAPGGTPQSARRTLT